jgi:site-specific DNA-methyltransferase (adenine-specific)
MELMKRYPDNHFELAIVDPPYGIGISGQKENKKGKKSDRKFHKEKGWDNKIPDLEYFNELKRVSKNQIVWGGNYFVKHLTEGHKGWMVWDKAQHGLTMSDCELAYSSFDSATRIFTQNRCILMQEGGTIHPTQKPVKLYEWILMNYAKEGDKILDTHLGSGSIALACHNLGYDLTACELDKDYFDSAIKRINEHKQQIRMF